MKLTTCFDSYLIGNGLWVYKFNVENVDKKYVKEAKRIDGDNYWDKCFALRVYYQEAREDEESYLECSILYITDDGTDLEFDYNPTKEEEKWLYDYVGIMKTWECVEVCPHCMRENIIQWNTEMQGFVTKCTHCGEKMMLCDECLHTVCQDGEPHDCDWCDDAGGVCHRDTSPVTLMTYGHYEEKRDIQHELNFEVPKNWLWGWIKENGYKSMDEFLNAYMWRTWDTTIDVYADALKEKVIINEWED